FDGIAAPLFLAGTFQATVQVPYELAGRKSAAVELVYRGIPSNVIQLPLVDSAPGLLTPLASTEAAAINQDGTVNSSSSPAVRGSIFTLFARGCGQTSPASATGVPARPPLAAPALPAVMTIGNRPAEIVFAGAAPGLAGVIQFNARIPTDIS